MGGKKYILTVICSLLTLTNVINANNLYIVAIYKKIYESIRALTNCLFGRYLRSTDIFFS